MSRLCSLAQLDLDHLDLIALGIVGKAGGIEMAIIIAASEITAADFPHQIAAIGAVIAANAAFTGVLIEISGRRTLVQRHHRMGGQRAKTHRGNIQPG